MNKIGVVFGLFITAVLVAGVAGSANYSPSNSAVEQNRAGALLADGSPRPPLPPPPVADGSPSPSFLPVLSA
jgi:hypothetical protein